jgi:hypothetical protein
MRYPVMLTVCCLAMWSAPSQSAGVDRIDITAFGVMSGPPSVRIGMSPSGIEARTAGFSKVAEVTTTIPACIGIRFGIVFSSASDGMPMVVTGIDKFPSPGLRKPGLALPIHENRFARLLIPGMRNDEMWYELDYPWELVPGEWTLELRDGNRLLASKTFRVVVPKKAECPSLSV